MHLTYEIVPALRDSPTVSPLTFTETLPVRSAPKGQWVTEWVSRHVMVTCYQLLSDLPTTCYPHSDAEIAL